MRCVTFLTLFVIASALTAVPTAQAADPFPTPSLYPKSWELDFVHGKPTRIVVQPPGSAVPKAYWYMIYTVTNNTDSEQLFLPSFELATEDGRVIRNDINIPQAVFNAVKQREGVRFLEQAALRSEEHTSELQSRLHLVCRLLLEKKKKKKKIHHTVI